MKRILVVVCVISVAVGYFVWTKSQDVSQASDPREELSAPQETSVSVYMSHREDIIQSIEDENLFGYTFHMKNLRNRMAAVFVSEDDFTNHIGRLRLLNSLLESGFSGIDVVAALDEVLLE
ncbi:MAG: hypothetical protein CMI52_00120 [Parcubacteria group bacterium]|nr:hypothetical protein [Parcubacteria group bacterium]|tara:strand:+ start:153 stop:515 length:363 start_codon:yes stop_codon:yes gene_type:complete